MGSYVCSLHSGPAQRRRGACPIDGLLYHQTAFQLFLVGLPLAARLFWIPLRL
jgi:hypothetical protein